MSSPTLTRLGKRVQRTGAHGERRTANGGDTGFVRTPNADRHTPRLRAIAWHRAMLLALADLDDVEAQDAAGQYHMQQLARYLREGAAASAGAPAGQKEER